MKNDAEPKMKGQTPVSPADTQKLADERQRSPAHHQEGTQQQVAGTTDRTTAKTVKDSGNYTLSTEAPRQDGKSHGKKL